MENINLELYKAFYCVAKNKNITRTAEELLISQPALTQTIKKLEDQIGYKLFFRTKKGMELTEEGEILFHDIKDSMDCLNNAKEKLDLLKSKREVIRIGGGTTLLKHNALKGFKKMKEKYPSVRIEIKKDMTKNLFDELKESNLDLIFFHMSYKNIDQEFIREIPIEIVEDTFVADSNTFSYLKNKKIQWKDLENLPFVLQSEVSTSRKYLNSLCYKNKVLLKDSYELSSYELVIEFVKAGLGIGFVNKNHIKKELKEGTLFELKTNYKIPKRQVGIAVNKKKENNKYIKEFIEMIREKEKN